MDKTNVNFFIIILFICAIIFFVIFSSDNKTIENYNPYDAYLAHYPIGYNLGSYLMPYGGRGNKIILQFDNNKISDMTDMNYGNLNNIPVSNTELHYNADGFANSRYSFNPLKYPFPHSRMSKAQMVQTMDNRCIQGSGVRTCLDPLPDEPTLPNRVSEFCVHNRFKENGDIYKSIDQCWEPPRSDSHLPFQYHKYKYRYYPPPDY